MCGLKIILTGHTGFIGRELASKLSKKYYVLGISRSKPIDETIDYLELDLSDGVDQDVVSEIKSRMGQPDVIIHLAAYVPRTRTCRKDDYVTSMRSNVLGTLNMLAIAKKLHPKKVILASTMAVYGRVKEPATEEEHALPLTFYGKSKLLAEVLCENFAITYNIKCISLRFASVYGPGMCCELVFALFLNRALRSEPIVVHKHMTGFERLDLVYVKDAVSAIIRSIEYSQDEVFEVFNVGALEHITTLDLATKIVKATGSRSPIVVVETKEVRSGPTLAISKAASKIGWIPTYTIDAALQEILPRWYCEDITCK